VYQATRISLARSSGRRLAKAQPEEMQPAPKTKPPVSSTFQSRNPAISFVNVVKFMSG
jgi:hypothetical protein